MNGLRRMAVLKEKMVVTREEVINHTQEVVDKDKEKIRKLKAYYDWRHISRFLDVIFGYTFRIDSWGEPLEEDKKLVSEYLVLSEIVSDRVLLFTLDGFECKVKVKNYNGIPIYGYYIKRKRTSIFVWKRIYGCEHFLKLAKKGVI